MNEKRRKIIRGKGWPAVLIGMLATFPLMNSPVLSANNDTADEKDGHNISYNLFLEVDEGQMNLHATQVNLSKILAAMATQTGLTVVLDKEADHPLTIDIENVSLDIALRHILRDVSYARIWKSAPMEDNPDKTVLIALYVYPQGKSGPGNNSVILGLGTPREMGREPDARGQSQGTIPQVLSNRTDIEQRNEGLIAYQEKKNMQIYLEKKKLAFLSSKKQKENEKNESALTPGGLIPKDLKDDDWEAYIKKKEMK